ncbi:MAG: hypothetical protein R3324_14380, partial [Halobacteriales archaeon]|nr:hypothetical protein [Halobacteriales archaeon]
SSPVSFEWTAVAEAIGYDLYVDQGDGATLRASTTTATTATVELVPASTTWYVEAKFDGCPPTRSANVTFTVVGEECTEEAPELVSPADGVSGLESPVTFQWTSVPGASSYRVWVEAEESFPVVVGTTADTTLTAQVPSGELNWFVQALIEGCPPNISEVRSLSVTPGDDCPSGVPNLVAPEQGVALDPPITFEWTPVEGAIRYAVWASIDGDTESIVGTTEGEESTSLTREMEAGEIEWFVEVFFDGCPSLKTDSRSFTVNEVVECVSEAPQLIAPIDGATGLDGLVEFEWSSVPTAVGYRLWTRTNGVGEFSLAGATLAETSLEIPIRGTMVEWSVEAVFIECPATRSGTASFELEPPVVCPTDVSELITPIGGVTVSESRVNLVWTAVDGADAYEVWVIREDGVPSRVGLTPASELEIEVDLDEGAHEWWVTA